MYHPKKPLLNSFPPSSFVNDSNVSLCILAQLPVGVNCEMKLCPLTRQPCHQGDCTSEGECACYEGYSGRHCHTKECGSNKCSQFSVCRNLTECECTSRYSGHTCSTGMYFVMVVMFFQHSWYKPWYCCGLVLKKCNLE